jgi:hypothetical protein
MPWDRGTRCGASECGAEPRIGWAATYVGKPPFREPLPSDAPRHSVDGVASMPTRCPPEIILIKIILIKVRCHGWSQRRTFE